MSRLCGEINERVNAFLARRIKGDWPCLWADVLAYMGFPVQHRAKLHGTDPLERLNGEIKRRSEVVGNLPNETAVTRLIGALLLEQNNEWAVQRARYISLETIAH